MSAFQAVNTGLAPEPYNRNGEETTPTTPRPQTAPSLPPPPARIDDATTPTRATFGALASQRPLPAEPFPAAIAVPESTEAEKKPLTRGDSQYSNKSRDSEDVDMDESDGEDDGSDEESVNADGTRSGKKKKSQRFFCVDYPPCNLSFTRSEHLARHIRKHTGERPFQCHCSRRFSRLDNLRQHAQTVHVNEDIPQDSLAATGTRFQRQVRTDRVRPPGSRSRASTAGSATSQGRGHHRNSLSASSISSVGSTYSQRPEDRRRPPPLVMASDPRAHGYDQYRAQSPGFSTPTSATFSTGQNSPRWGSGMQSPIQGHSRTASLYAGHRTPGRRLSVPSGANPFQSPHGYSPNPLTPMNSSNTGFMSPTSVASPTNSTSSSAWGRRESLSSVTDADWRRRTWHPETHSNFTSRLMNVSTPSQPYYNQAQPAQTTRLPGIASFDPVPHRPVTPPLRRPSPMMIDTPSRAPMLHAYPRDYESREAEERRNWELHRGLARLDVTQSHSDAGTWASEANRAVQAQAEQVHAAPAPAAPPSGPSVRFENPPSQAYAPAPHEPIYAQGPPTPITVRQQHLSAPPLTPREHKRQAWYFGPVLHDSRRAGQIQNQRTSPEDSSSSEGVPGTPGSAQTELTYQPGILHSSGWVEPQRPAGQEIVAGGYVAGGGNGEQQPYGYSPAQRGMGEPRQEDKPDGMMRLEALVAVATSENKAF